MDKLRIPFIGALTKNFLGFEIRPPKLHVATVRYGVQSDAIVSDRWTYRGTHLYKGYDTRQVFRENYSEGTFSFLSPYHVTGRINGYKLKPSERLKAHLLGAPVVKPAPKPRKGVYALLAGLPAGERIRHYNRLQALGALA